MGLIGNWLDRWSERSTRNVAQRSSRRSALNRIGKLTADHTSDQFLNQLRGRKSELQKVLATVFSKPYVRISDLNELHRETASRHLRQLVEKGVLREEKSGRDKVFLNEVLLGIFKLDEEKTA